MEKFGHEGRFRQQRQDYSKETRNSSHHGRGKRRHGHCDSEGTGVYPVSYPQPARVYALYQGEGKHRLDQGCSGWRRQKGSMAEQQ